MEWRNIFTIFFCYLDADYTTYSLARELQKNHNDHTEGLNIASKFLKRIKVPTIFFLKKIKSWFHLMSLKSLLHR